MINRIARRIARFLFTPAPRVTVETPVVLTSYDNNERVLTDYEIVKDWQQEEGLSYRKIMAETGLSYRQVRKHCLAD